jgi:hypothetical protein
VKREIEMDENLVGYLLRALDAETQREVEAYLRAQPEVAKKLEQLRQALQPLAADRESPAPPSGLRMRTLARVAEYRCRDQGRGPMAPSIRSHSAARSWWRRADVLVAAAVLLVVLPLIPPGLNQLRHQRFVKECQNNLRSIYAPLFTYSQLHDGALPRVEEQPPRHVAGIFVPILREARLLEGAVPVNCPGTGRPPPPDVSLEELSRVQAANPEHFMDCARQLSGCYGYTLGYRDSEHRLAGLRLDPAEHNGNEYLPIMADRPPFDDQRDYLSATGINSPNHDGAGQNVLFLSGRTAFCKDRLAGVNRKDIYLNRDQRPEAGVDKWDSVVGGSGFHPTLPPSRR